ncbi:hypothetical protein [Kitasatospora sp. NPDC001547]|uniref:hypothetical protein n=1 Tax=Kitasatospora sp. NPDC001547 TaxID=3364015 RepID=UPI0036809464
MSDTDPTLPAPVVEEADGDVLTPIEGRDLTISIPPYHAMEAGDTIVLHWGGGSAPIQHQLTDTQDGEPISISVPWDDIPDFGGREINFSYQIVDRAGNVSRSAPAQITIEQP